ncbi:MAG: hypothetical protein AUH84_07670 [Thaumarchaeota archaeon 13_1_40CM_4_38_7]|nr:MAG: hypothetical protein AUH84_07670 [Thaumarchaeota archaeon 13_1_40CM_4_38_7]OLC91484.1 MAG: hypothetical protein AUI92_07765 [Thaumarchaeota archaeon 13_1_40CM_3_38_6]
MKKNVGEGLVDLNATCKNVLDLDDKIRFAGIINEKGKLVAGGLRSGLKSLEDPKDDEMLFMELALRVKMRQEFDKQLGTVKFSLSMREKVIVMSFPLGNSQVLYVSADRNLDFASVAMKILEIVQ